MAVVVHVVDAELLRVAVDEEVLPVEVGDGDLLVAELVNVLRPLFVSFSSRSKTARLYW